MMSENGHDKHSLATTPAPEYKGYSMLCVYEPVYGIGLMASIISLNRVKYDPESLWICCTSRDLKGLTKIIERLRMRSVDVDKVRIAIVGQGIQDYCSHLRYSDHFTPAICYRIFYAEIIPALMHPLIYFDLDMMWMDSPRKLISHMENSDLLLAVPQPSPIEYLRNVQITTEAYFNSGIFVLNLGRGHEISSKVVRTKSALREISNWSKYLDQDALNIGFNRSWRQLPPRWNVMTTEATDESISTAGILHASGAEKPWHYPNRHPYKQIFQNLFISSNFYKFQSLSFSASIRRIIRSIKRKVFSITT